MKNARFALFVCPRSYRGNARSAALTARRFEASAFPKMYAVSFETFCPLILIGADAAMAGILRVHNRVERLQ